MSLDIIPNYELLLGCFLFSSLPPPVLSLPTLYSEIKLDFDRQNIERSIMCAVNIKPLMDNLGSCFSEDYSILIMFRKHKTLFISWNPPSFFTLQLNLNKQQPESLDFVLQNTDSGSDSDSILQWLLYALRPQQL